MMGELPGAPPEAGLLACQQQEQAFLPQYPQAGGAALIWTHIQTFILPSELSCLKKLVGGKLIARNKALQWEWGLISRWDSVFILRGNLSSL